MPFQITVPQSTSEEWTQVIGEAWYPDPGSATPTPGFQSDSGQLDIYVDGPWSLSTTITKMRITYTGVSELDLGVYPFAGDETWFEPYLSGQEIEILITPDDPLADLYFWTNGGQGEFEVTSIEFLLEEEEPVDPQTLDCYDYTDDKYWDSSASIGTFYDIPSPMWTSVNSGGDEILELIPIGTVPNFEPSWSAGFQPEYLRIFFTGPSTVDIVLKQMDPNGDEISLGEITEYSSGDVFSLGYSFADDEFKISSITVGNTSSSTTIIVSAVKYCFGALECQTEISESDAALSPAKLVPLEDVMTISVYPGSYGSLMYQPYVPNMSYNYCSFPLTITSADANNFTVTGRGQDYSGPGDLAINKSTTNGTLTGLIYSSYQFYTTPMKVIIKNDELGTECDTFEVRFGTPIQELDFDTTALNNPVITLTEGVQMWDGYDELFAEVVVTVAPQRFGCVRYVGDDPLGGYNISVQAHSQQDVQFFVGVYDGNNVYQNGDHSSTTNGLARVYVNYPSTNDFKVLIYNSFGRDITRFTVYWPQPF